VPEVSQITYNLKEVASLMIRHQGIRSGLWMIWTRFAHAATNIVPPEGEGGPAGPASVSVVVELGIQKANEPGPMTVDASEVWKETKPRSSRKTTKK